MRWIVDGNNVFGSRPDGWWNDRPAAATRFTQAVAEWCRGHHDDVVVVFDAPLAPETALLGGGNLRVVESERRGRDAADDTIVALAIDAAAAGEEVVVVTSDRGLRARLPRGAHVTGARRFLEVVGNAR